MKRTRRLINNKINTFNRSKSDKRIKLTSQAEMLQDIIDTNLKGSITVIQRMDMNLGTCEDWYQSNGGELINLISFDSITIPVPQIDYLCRTDNNYNHRAALVFYLTWKTKTRKVPDNVVWGVYIRRLNAVREEHVSTGKYTEIENINGLHTNKIKYNENCPGGGINKFVKTKITLQQTDNLQRNEHFILSIVRDTTSSKDSLVDWAQLYNFKVYEYG